MADKGEGASYRNQDWFPIDPQSAGWARSDAVHYFIGFDSNARVLRLLEAIFIYLFICSVLKSCRSILNIGISPVAVTSPLRVD